MDSLKTVGAKFFAGSDLGHPFNRYPFLNFNNRYSNEFDLFRFEKKLCFQIENFLKKISFEYCLEQRVFEIKNLKKPIYLLYSGGVDSICMAIAFKKHLTTSELQNVKVLCTVDSIFENQQIFNKFIQPTFPVFNLNTYLKKKIDGAVVSGEPADLLFESEFANHLRSRNSELILIENFKTHGPIAFDILFPNQGQKIFDFYKSCIRNCPFEVKSCFTFLWWLSYTLKWNYVVNRFETFSLFNNSFHKTRVINFYESTLFEEYALNYQFELQQNFLSLAQVPPYKKPATDYINLHLDNLFSYKQWSKVPSLIYLIKFTELYSGITEDNRIVSNLEDYHLS